MAVDTANMGIYTLGFYFAILAILHLLKISPFGMLHHDTGMKDYKSELQKIATTCNILVMQSQPPLPPRKRK